MLKALFCDLDGTILDTIGSITYYLSETMTKYGYTPVTREECNYFAGDGSRVLLRRALASKGVTDEALAEVMHNDYKHSYDKAPLYLTEVFAGMRETLETLKARGILLGVISNKPHTATVPVVRHFFGDLFDVVLGASDAYPLKPDRAMADYATRELGITPAECAYLGDTRTDILFGKAMGAYKNIGVSWGFRPVSELEEYGADMIISSPSELLEVFL